MRKADNVSGKTMKKVKDEKQRTKGILYKTIIGILVAAGILGLFVVRKLYISRENLLMAYEKEILPGIVCYGDSLTYGSGGGGCLLSVCY